jgi:hypothetical protein
MRAPRNTATEDPLLTFAQMAFGGPNAIERQEAGGQREFVNSDTLPANISADDKATLEAAGVKFIGPVEGDDLFVYVTLPSGWKKSATEHSMHNNLLDDKGRERAGIFYKAAFYDRRAGLRCNRRYSLRIDYERIDRDGVAVCNVLDGATIIHSTDPVKVNKERRWDASDAADKAGEEWLTAKFPEWRKSSAYWD